MSRPILPGATIGILGSGQLGRMLAQSARRMGYRVHTLSPAADSPTGQIADREVVAAYDDLEAIARFARDVDVVTFEFENIAAESAAVAARHVPVRPKGDVLHLTQNRYREKHALTAAGLPTARYEAVDSLEQLHDAIARLGMPCILKTAGFGYDGKGQARITADSDPADAWQAIGAGAAILEAVVDFEAELSVVAARGPDGAQVDFGLIENRHVDHILDVSIADMPLTPGQTARAREIAATVMREFDVVGVLCIEMFLTRDGELLINELAPRPHNSGHLTIEACASSQFDQQLRAVCGLPLGDTTRHAPTAMANLLGDLWNGGEPDWAAALADPAVNLHLYGKAEARPGRKMGHLTASAASRDEAVRRVTQARSALLRPRNT
ncbi:5-(carboxyamino)imidazole ribonucleotide synthase [Spiribacter vilamensis]|uniref:N5-carboxyaminoimidazole ribonucleotide synthase n=1 Tax=Spiribacter vilamensis TaxID=531306 RepID=A0A4Q8D1T3_9GAMM|nr:5-(carboxyamino)imidazole ribonucleotide synthase [Spiribacter vilamensis]RZU99308.1 5-(carboxyamino)imidazole ribonucleotide synthase [Spiribacter vilamensis]TVO61708.1 5-(carboxyamino)imidazole ribonucleotide synthase [Spiribacter vilamensis]